MPVSDVVSFTHIISYEGDNALAGGRRGGLLQMTAMHQSVGPGGRQLWLHKEFNTTSVNESWWSALRSAM